MCICMCVCMRGALAAFGTLCMHRDSIRILKTFVKVTKKERDALLLKKLKIKNNETLARAMRLLHV